MKNNSKTRNKIALTLLMIFLTFSAVLADDNVTMSGYVQSAETGEGLIGSTIYVEELKTGTATNAYGFYSLTIPKGNCTIRYSYIGYEQDLLPISLSESNVKNIELQPSSAEVVEIVVRSVAEGKKPQSGRNGGYQIITQRNKDDSGDIGRTGYSINNSTVAQG